MISKLAKNITLLSTGLIVGGLLGVNMGAFAERDASGSLPVLEVRRLTDIYEIVRQNYVEPVDSKKVLEGAIDGMISSLDPHSSYLDKEAYKDLQESMKGAFGGLGMQVDLDEPSGLVRVTAPIEDTPAWKAGVKPGDLIFKIDDTPVKGMNLEAAVKRMRGEPKTPVQLTILRKKENKPLVFKLVRDIINVASVKFQLAESDYGYVRIIQFQENTTADLNKALKTLYKDNKAPLKGLIIDLRNDPGGSLNSAIGVSSAFLPANVVVVSTDGRLPEAKKEFFSRREYYINREEYKNNRDPLEGLPPEVKTVPVVVLINGYSASASEIVAGALQDHKRALVVGTRSFGKGSVQTVMPLPSYDKALSLRSEPETAIKITTSRYFTPAKRSIQATGINPDVVVEETDEDGEVIDDRLVTEADLSGHLSNPNGEEDKTAPAATTGNKASSKTEGKNGKPRRRERDENGAPILISKSDTQLNQALAILKVQQLLINRPAAAAAK